MSIITRIVAGKRNPSRANVYVDGKFAFALSIDEAVKNHLKPSLEITEETVEGLRAKDNADKVYGKILNFLSFRPRSVKEVKDRLYQYEIKDVMEQKIIIEKLQSHGYLDDLTFAKWFIESRNTHKLKSPRLIRQELAAKGISRELLDQVMTEVVSPEVTISRLLSKKLGDKRHLNPAERQKISAFLARQGFPWEKIAEVVKRFESE